MPVRNPLFFPETGIDGPTSRRSTFGYAIPTAVGIGAGIGLASVAMKHNKDEDEDEERHNKKEYDYISEGEII